MNEIDNQNTTDISYEEWMLREINRSIAEADAGQFATDEEVASAFRFFRTGNAVPPIAE